MENYDLQKLHMRQTKSKRAKICTIKRKANYLRENTNIFYEIKIV